MHCQWPARISWRRCAISSTRGRQVSKTRLIAAKAAYSAHAHSRLQISNRVDCAELAHGLLYPGRTRHHGVGTANPTWDVGTSVIRPARDGLAAGDPLPMSCHASCPPFVPL